jgi:hypothetical protein
MYYQLFSRKDDGWFPGRRHTNSYRTDTWDVRQTPMRLEFYEPDGCDVPSPLKFPQKKRVNSRSPLSRCSTLRIYFLKHYIVYLHSLIIVYNVFVSVEVNFFDVGYCHRLMIHSVFIRYIL